MRPAKTTDTMETDTIPAIIIFGMMFCRRISFSSTVSPTALDTSFGTIKVPGKPKKGGDTQSKGHVPVEFKNLAHEDGN